MRAAVLFLFIAVPAFADEEKEKALREAMPKEQAVFSDDLAKFQQRRTDIDGINNGLAKADAQKQYDADLKKWAETFTKHVAKNGLSDWVAPVGLGGGSTTLLLNDGRVFVTVDLKRVQADMLPMIKTVSGYPLMRFTISPDPKLTRVTVNPTPFPLANIRVDGKLLKKLERLP